VASSCDPKWPAANSRVSRVLRVYEWTDHHAKVTRKESIAQREFHAGQPCTEKERLTRDAGAAEKNRVDVQTQCDRKLEMGGKITRTAEEAKEHEKIVIKLRTQAETREGVMKDEEVVREASGRDLREVRASSILVICFHVG
jgi:hypothetical protein